MPRIDPESGLGNELPIACSWSGGKDSCLALHRARSCGARPVALLTMFDAGGERSRSHGLRPEVLAAQAVSLGLPLRLGRASWQSYEMVFKTQLLELVADGVRDVVFGDIDLLPHREWEERVCRETGARAHLPLWLGRRRSLLDEFWAAGFVCRIIAVDGARLGAEVLGEPLTPTLADTFEAHGIDACGENGEFHTVVTAGPGFAHPLELDFGVVVASGGHLAIDAVLRPLS